MKKVITCIVCLIGIGAFLYPISSTTATEKLIKTDYCAEDTVNFYLEVNGSIRQMKNVMGDSGDNPWLDSAIVTIYQNNTIYNTIYTSRRGKCTFKLPLDRVYTVELSKPGFVSKKFEVSTKIPPNKKDAFTFDFDMDIFAFVEGLDTKVLEKPIALVYYNITNNQFEYDAAYTNRINSDLKLMYRNYYILEKAKKKKK